MGTRTNEGLSSVERAGKRAFDVALSGAGLAGTWWLILGAAAVARVDTGKTGFFSQDRIGRDGERFRIFKIRTMRDRPGVTTDVTTVNDPRLTRLGRFFRKTKIDELPQLWNVLKGDMSFVGPRPEVPGFADVLEGEDRIILTVRPGITGPATLKYRNEEELLRDNPDPIAYNAEVLFPDKVRINAKYVREYSLLRDVGYILRTLTGR